MEPFVPQEHFGTRKEYRTEWLARNRMCAPGAHAFVDAVLPIFKNGPRTRFIIAVTVNGPATPMDIYRTIADSRHERCTMPAQELAKLGVVVEARYRGRLIYGLNNGHPAYREIREFAHALARKWPPPAWPRHKARLQPVPMPVPVPTTLLGSEHGTRSLLVVAAAGQATAAELGSLTHADPPSAFRAMQRYLDMGLLRRAETTTQRGERPYQLNEDFFAYPELKAMLARLIRGVYPEAIGYARTLKRHAVRGYERL